MLTTAHSGQAALMLPDELGPFPPLVLPGESGPFPETLPGAATGPDPPLCPPFPPPTEPPDGLGLLPVGEDTAFALPPS